MRFRGYSKMFRLATIVIAAAAATAAAPESASAIPTTVYASPGGSGTACTQSEPCEIATALEIASSGDTVILAGDEGSYGSPQSPIIKPLEVKSGVTFKGAYGEPRPEIYSAAMVAIESGEGGEGQRISNLKIEDSAKSATALFGSGAIERVIAKAPDGTGCESGPVTTIIDSICAGEYGINDQVSGIGLWTLDLRNDTVYATREAAKLVSHGPGLRVTALNTILRGGFVDIDADQITGSVTITLEHSNYANVSATGGASISAPGSESNQTAMPLFVDAAQGNLREAAGSPTIDAGVNDPANGEFDLEGNPRIQAGYLSCGNSEATAITDIGAYEAAPLALPCPPPAPMPPNTSISGIKIHHRGATFRFTGRANTDIAIGFECELDERPFSNCASPKSYRHLQPGRYIFTVRAVDAHGFDLTPARKRFTIRRR
jgi:hypothetical protein